MNLRIKETVDENGKHRFTVQKRRFGFLWWCDLSVWLPCLDPELYGPQVVCCDSIEKCLSLLQSLKKEGILPTVQVTVGHHSLPPPILNA